MDPVLEVVAFTTAHGQGAASAHTCLRFMDYVLSVPTAAARAMLADVALVPLDGVSQLNATLGAQGAEGCFALRDVPDALLYAARLKAAAAASLLRRRMLLRRSRSLLQEAYPGVGRMQVNRRVCGMELPSAWLDRGRPSRWSHVGVSHADGGDRVGGRGCVCESKLIGFCQLP